MAQGKGVGRSLVKYVEGLAKSKGCYLIKTDTTENAKSVPWKAYGFWKKMSVKKILEKDYLPSMILGVFP